jgi:hypothetical protein
LFYLLQVVAMARSFTLVAMLAALAFAGAVSAGDLCLWAPSDKTCVYNVQGFVDKLDESATPVDK